jgi:hypothetical protein
MHQRSPIKNQPIADPRPVSKSQRMLPINFIKNSLAVNIRVLSHTAYYITKKVNCQHNFSFTRLGEIIIYGRF